MVKCSDNTLYTGVTTNLERRLHEHNTTCRGAKYTKSRRPVQLVYSSVCENRSHAQKVEWAFKQLSRAEKLERIEEKNDEKKSTSKRGI